jgi:hypothetical protein
MDGGNVFWIPPVPGFCFPVTESYKSNKFMDGERLFEGLYLGMINCRASWLTTYADSLPKLMLSCETCKSGFRPTADL